MSKKQPLEDQTTSEAPQPAAPSEDKADIKEPAPAPSKGNPCFSLFALVLAGAFAGALLGASSDRFDVMPHSAHQWLEAGQIIPVHDGDEVIQTFIRSHGIVSASETVLVVPDSSATSFAFRTVVTSLADKGVRVVTFDFPGTGHTAATTRGQTKNAKYLVEFIASVVESLQLRPVHLILHGNAAQVGVDFAIKYPKRARSVTFVGSSPDGSAFTLSPYWHTTAGASLLTSPIGPLALQAYFAVYGGYGVDDCDAYAFFIAHADHQYELTEKEGKLSPHDLHKMNVSTVWITMADNKFRATSKYDDVAHTPQTYFAPELHPSTLANALAAFINTLVCQSFPYW